MYQVSNDFKNRIQSLTRVFTLNIEVQYLDKNGTTKTVTLDDTDISNGSFKHEEATQSSDEFTVGGVFGANVSFTLVNDDKFNDIDFMGARIVPTVGLLLDDNYTVYETWMDLNQYTWESMTSRAWGQLIKDTGLDDKLFEYVPLGTFNVDTVDEHRTTTEIRAIDDMLKLDVPYDLSKLSYPANLRQILIDLCNVGNVSQSATTFTNDDYRVLERPEGDLTLRDVLSYVAEISGSYARFNRLGSLELGWYDNNSITVTPDHRSNLVAKKHQIQITGISKTIKGEGEEEEDATYLSGLEGYVIDLTDNPLLQENFQTPLINIYEKVRHTKFTPYDATWQGNPAIQAGDKVVQVSVGRELESGIIEDGETYNTIITHSVYSYRGSGEMSAKGIPNTSRDNTGSVVNHIKRKVEAEINKEISRLDIEREKAGHLIANMLGGHLIPTNDAIYIADSPDLETATKVWKWGIGGFGYFPNGIYDENGVPNSPLTGVTAEGSIVADLLAAKIVTADMIETGVLQSQDGKTWIDLRTGYFALGGITYDETGFQILVDNQPIKDYIDASIVDVDMDKILGDLQDLIDTTIEDTILGQLEASHFKSIVFDLEYRFDDMIAEYTRVYNNEYLTGTPKSQLRTSKIEFESAHNSLINELIRVTDIGTVTPEQKVIIESMLDVYKTKLSIFYTKLTQAQTLVDQALKDYIESVDGKAEISMGKIDDLISDGKITPSEKLEIQTEWRIIKREYPLFLNKANQFGVTTEKNNYKLEYGRLETHMDWVLEDMTITSDIIKSATRNRFEQYYDTRSKLDTAILTATKEQFRGYDTTLADATKKADAAVDKANNAINVTVETETKVNNIAKDNWVTPKDREELRTLRDDISREYVPIYDDATYYGFYYSRDEYQTAYMSIAQAFGVLLEYSKTDETVQEDMVEFRKRLKQYNSKKQAILDLVANELKEDVASKVPKDGIKAAINASGESVQIEGTNINLVGALTVYSGDKISDLHPNGDLGTIKAGRLYANEMDINLNRGQILIDSKSNVAGLRLRNANGQVIIDGQSNMYKIAKEITVELQVTAGTRSFSDEWRHHLNYTPTFVAYHLNAPSSSNLSGNLPMPAIGVGRVGGDIVMSSIIRVSVDDTHVRVSMERNATAGTYPKIRFILYKEALI